MSSVPNTQNVKMWVILTENYNYKADTIAEIFAHISCEPLAPENSVKLEDWIEDGYKMEKRLMFNMDFLEDLENFLIKNGIFFNWIIYENDYIGIRIQPTKIDFNPILKDCMTFDNYSTYREWMNLSKNLV